METNPLDERQNPRRKDAGRPDPRPVSLEEAELVEKVKAGEVEAYAELVLRYQDRVFNACWRISGHLEDARDLTQEAFLKGLERIDSFRHESGFYTWIFRVAVNLALSHRRKAKRRATASLEQALGQEGTQAEGLRHHGRNEPRDSPVGAAGDAELQGLLARSLQQLDEEQRAVIVLRDIEGFDYRRISEILDVPPGTVKSRLFRARMALREIVAAAAGWEK